MTLADLERGVGEILIQEDELRTRIAGTIGNITAPLYAQLDPADIETTVRTLQRLTTLVMESSAAPSAATGGR